MRERYGVYVNGKKVAEYDDKAVAERLMNRLAAHPFDPTDSFDVIPEHD